MVNASFVVTTVALVVANANMSLELGAILNFFDNGTRRSDIYIIMINCF